MLLIFDEVVTGFRFAYGGAQAYYGVTPDICTLGKAIGGGFALAAIAGRADIMAHFDKNAVAEDAFMTQIGTLSGNPMAAAAGLKTLEILKRPGAYEQIFKTGRALMEGYARSSSARASKRAWWATLPCLTSSSPTRDVTDYRSSLGDDIDHEAAERAAARARRAQERGQALHLACAHTTRRRFHARSRRVCALRA